MSYSRERQEQDTARCECGDGTITSEFTVTMGSWGGSPENCWPDEWVEGPITPCEECGSTVSRDQRHKEALSEDRQRTERARAIGVQARHFTTQTGSP